MPPATHADTGLARAERILSGDIRPDDYLPITPEVRRLTDREMEYARARATTAGITELATEVERRQLHQKLLLVHCPEEHVGYLEDESGVIVLVRGLENIRPFIDHFPYEQRKRVGFAYIDIPGL